MCNEPEHGTAAVSHTEYGVSASQSTTGPTSAHHFVDEVGTGQIAVDQPTSGWDVHHPFGGFKDSGSHFKEQGVEGPRFSSRIKTGAIGHGGRP